MEQEYVEQDEYVQLGDIEHVILRPDTFVGSTIIEEKQLSVVKFTKLEDDSIGYYVEEETVSYCAAMERVYLEILSNAFDNAAKSRELGLDPGIIKVSVNDGIVTIYNEGRPISTKIDSKQKIHIPQMIFSSMRSGSNFNDDEERKYAGRNGYGAKLTNILSKEFNIRLRNGVEGRLYKQSFSNNMRIIGQPEILETPKNGNSFTEISYKLDFGYFYAPKPNDKQIKEEHASGKVVIGKNPLHCKDCWDAGETKTMEDYCDTMISLMARHALDAAFNSNIPIYFNDVLFDIADPLEYAGAFIPIENIETAPIVIQDDDTRLVLLDTPLHGFTHSFANGMCTSRGGVHVNAWLKAFAEPIIRVLGKKGFKITVADIKPHVTLFLSVTVDKPKFDTQTKEKLTSPTPTVNLPTIYIKRFNGWKAVEEITRIAERKQSRKIAKDTDGRKVAFIRGIPKLDDAAWAGKQDKEKSNKTVLYLVEGDSAKTLWNKGLKYMKKELADLGLKAKPRDIFGCFPLRGKILNTMRADAAKKSKNIIINQLKTILGLKENLDYSIQKNKDSLRYGKVRILTDADDDGIHIKTLILQFLNDYGLLSENFVEALLTPVVLCGKEKFYSNDEFNKYKMYNKATSKVVYYKGLGSVDKKDVREIFEVPTLQKYEEFEEKDQKALELAFDKIETKKRKQLYRNLIKIDKKKPINVNCVEDVICDELVTYGETCNKRAIPGIMDGLKDVNRKIIFGILRANKTDFIAVPRIGGTIAECTDYKHGPESMNGSIILMAQDYPGSNNINLLEGKGEFGSRHKNGKDASAPRYIKVRPSPILKYIIRSEDDVILEYTHDEGIKAEPITYFPIIPMHMINGSNGIGWGWSTAIPSYNPVIIIKWIKNFIGYVKSDGKGQWKPPNLVPWYRNYNGQIFRDSKGNILNRGSFQDRTHVCIIDEIPILTSDIAYRSELDKLVTKGVIREWAPSHEDPNQPSYTIRGYEGGLSLKKLGLEKQLQESNLVVMGLDKIPVTYHDPQSLLVDWSEQRYKYYEERKTKYLRQLKEKLGLETKRYNFVKEVAIDKTLKILHRNEIELKKEMEEKDYPWSFTDMKIQSFTSQKLDSLKKKMENLKEEVELYEKVAPGDLWLSELEQLEQQLVNILNYEIAGYQNTKKIKKKKNNEENNNNKK